MYYTCSFLLSIKPAFQLNKRITSLCHYLFLRNIYFLFPLLCIPLCAYRTCLLLAQFSCHSFNNALRGKRVQQLVNLSFERHLIMAESLLGFLKHQNRRNNETPSKRTEKVPYAAQARQLPCIAKMQLPFLKKQIFFFGSLSVEKESW